MFLSYNPFQFHFFLGNKHFLSFKLTIIDSIMIVLSSNYVTNDFSERQHSFVCKSKESILPLVFLWVTWDYSRYLGITSFQNGRYIGMLSVINMLLYPLQKPHIRYLALFSAFPDFTLLMIEISKYYSLLQIQLISNISVKNVILFKKLFLTYSQWSCILHSDYIKVYLVLHNEYCST